MPPRLPFTQPERALIARLNTPSKVQRWLNALHYNTETGRRDAAQLPAGRAA